MLYQKLRVPDYITYLGMYPVLPTHVFVDRFKMCIGKGGGGISSMLNLVIGLLSGTRAVTGFL
jgi:hypothetical protein